MDIYVSIFFLFSKIGSDNRGGWPKAQFPAPLGFEPLDVSLFGDFSYLSEVLSEPCRGQSRNLATLREAVPTALGVPAHLPSLMGYLITVLLGCRLWDSPQTELFSDVCEEWGPVLPLTPGPDSGASSLFLTCPSYCLSLSCREPLFSLSLLPGAVLFEHLAGRPGLPGPSSS